MSNISNVLLCAEHEIGVVEVGGNNRGPRVEEYLAYVGLGPGNPWCAAFCSFVLGSMAGVKDGPCTGDTWALQAWGMKHGCLDRTPQVGDMFLLLGSDGMPVHTGFVTAVESYKVRTIEGNTGTASATDGDGVCAKSQYVSSCLFLHWAKVCKEVDPITRKVKIFRKPTAATVVVDGIEYPIKSMSINGEAPAAGSEYSIIVDY